MLVIRGAYIRGAYNRGAYIRNFTVHTKNDLTIHIERANAIPKRTSLVQAPKAQIDRLTFINT